MTLPVPLGVRIYNNFATHAFDRWVTDWVSDLSFRSVIPGGFASATIKLARPRNLQAPEVVTGTGIAAGTSATPDYIVVPDSQAASFSIGDRGWVYEDTGVDLSISDTFTRSVSNGWGTATSGQAWATSGGAASDYSVTGTLGRVAMNSVSVRRFTTISSGVANCVLSGTFTVSATAVGGSIAASVVFRYTDDDNFYMCQFLHDTAGTVDVSIVKREAGAFTTLANVANFIAYTPGTPLNFKAFCDGTDFGVRVWSGGTEPGVWHLVASDGSFSSGKVGTHSNLLSGNTNTLPVNVDYDGFVMTNTDLTGPIRFGGTRLRVEEKNSAFGFTNLVFDQSPGVTNIGDVFQVTRPAHFSYAAPVVWDELTNLFNRVQVVDLRSMEIVWEGRVEDPQRDSDTDTWTIGCLGAMVVASDIQRPIFYIDGTFDSWYTESVGGDMDTTFQNTTEAIFKLKDGQTYGLGVDSIGSWLYWGRGETADCSIARFDFTYGGAFSNANLRTDTWVADGGTINQQNSIDVTAWNAASIRKSNVVGTDFTGNDRQFVGFQLNIVTSGVVASDAIVYGTASDPRIQIMRFDRNGTELTAASNYTQDYITVAQVVEDIVGRFLVSRWNRAGSNIPYPGQVRPADAYIDTSGTAQIAHLTYYDGATAAQILNDLMTTAQPDAYWAIWESNYKATDGVGGISDYGFRFEWAEWPDGWGYQLTSEDGLSEQPNGEHIYNYVFYQYKEQSTFAKWGRIQNFWDGQNNTYLANAALTRAITIGRENPTDGGTAFSEADAQTERRGKTTNSGSVTVKRPVMFYDTGSNSNSGAGRMVDPWQIRPGKLARITDMFVRAKAHDFSHGDTAPPVELDGTVFRVVATEYNASDNSCRLELDQVTTWATENQIASTAAPKSTLVLKG